MTQTVVVEQLTTRVQQLETELAALWQVVRELTQQAPPPLAAGVRYADKAALRATFDKLLKDMGVTGQPVSADELQRLMAQENLEPNELSRGIIEMRDE